MGLNGGLMESNVDSIRMQWDISPTMMTIWVSENGHIPMAISGIVGKVVIHHHFLGGIRFQTNPFEGTS